MSNKWDETVEELSAEELALLAKVRKEFPQHFPEAPAAEQIRWSVHYTWSRTYGDFGDSEPYVTTWVGDTSYGTKEESDKAIEQISSWQSKHPDLAGEYAYKSVAFVRVDF